MKPSKKNPLFLGYVIASDKEDFLQHYTFNQYEQNAVWNMFPDKAKLFKTINEASAVIGLMQFFYPVFVLEIYDLGKQVALNRAELMPVPDWLYDDGAGFS
jgi:hypothetical protein